MDSERSSEPLKGQQQTLQETRERMVYREAGRHGRHEGRKGCGVVRNENGQRETLLRSQPIKHTKR